MKPYTGILTNVAFKLYVTALVVLTILSVWHSANAQDNDVPTRFYDFNEILLRGDIERPDGLDIRVRDRASFESMTDLYRSFMDEIEESAEEPGLE